MSEGQEDRHIRRQIHKIDQMTDRNDKKREIKKY